MKTLYSFLMVLAVPVTLLLISFSSGAPGGYTNSPMDGNNCTSCHTGMPLISVEDWITTNIPATGYVAGQKYTITATGTHNGVGKFGFQVTAEDKNGKSGTFVITDAGRTKFSTEGNAWVTHTSAGTAVSGNSASWSMDWIAPPEGTGLVTFYATFNAANADGTNNGDVIYGTAKSFGESTVGIDENLLASSIMLYPNPVVDFLNLELPTSSQVKVFDMSGRLVAEMVATGSNTRIDVSGYDNGAYIVRVEFEGNVASKRFLKR